MVSQQHKNPDCFIKLLLLGDAGVGKSSLMHRYAKGEFAEALIGTAGVDHVVKNIEHMNKTVHIQIWDTAGQARFRESALHYFRGTVGVVLVYDVTEQKSFENLDYWINRIRQNGETDLQIILIGNKIDMINEVNVNQEQAVGLAKEHGIPYFQTSAKDATNTEMAFKVLLSNIMNKPSLVTKIDFKSNVRIGFPRQTKQNSKCC